MEFRKIKGYKPVSLDEKIKVETLKKLLIKKGVFSENEFSAELGK